MIASGLPSVVTALALSLALVSGIVRLRLPPHLAARVLSVLIVGATVVSSAVSVVLAAAYLAHVPVFGGALRWCTMKAGVHGAVEPWIGIPALVFSVVGVVRAARVVHDHRRLLCRENAGVQVVDDRSPFALTLPGRGGQVVVSCGLLEELDSDEVNVVLAHEHAHARYRHDRHLLAAAVSCALVPPLVVLARPLRFAVERWADEAAARQCGDRRLVAATLGRVALSGSPYRATAGIGGGPVSARVAALMRPPRRSANRMVVSATWAGVLAAGVFAVHLLQHLSSLVGALCRH